jgi:hypothetical protein
MVLPESCLLLVDSTSYAMSSTQSEFSESVSALNNSCALVCVQPSANGGQRTCYVYSSESTTRQSMELLLLLRDASGSQVRDTGCLNFPRAMCNQARMLQSGFQLGSNKLAHVVHVQCGLPRVTCHRPELHRCCIIEPNHCSQEPCMPLAL